jgi:uncharacterized protein (TIGR02001 family)
MTHRRIAAVPVLTTVALALSLACAPPARAATSGSVALPSDYLFRGVSQTATDPALQAGVEYSTDSGFYVGAWGSNISWLSDLSTPDASISSSLEFDVYVGWRHPLGEHAALDVGAIGYFYPGDFPDGFNSADTGELYAALNFTPSQTTTVGAKASYAVTDLFGYADSDGSSYVEVNAGWQFHPGWTAAAHAGHQWIAHNGDFDYAEWRVGLTRAFDNGFSVAAAWNDTDADRALYTNPQGDHLADGAWTLTLAKAF